MGSRGQALKSGGFTEYRYHTIARYNNVRFVAQNNANENFKLTEMSNSPWAVYVGVNNNGIVKTITFYNGSRKKFKEIDIDKAHHGLSPHVHECNPKTSLRIQGLEARALTKKEENKVKKILAFYKKHNLKEYVLNGDKMK